MGENSGIQWTKHTWNPWQGCQKVSPGCDNCYMFRDKARFGQNPEIVVRSKDATFNRPLRWDAEAKAAGRRDYVFVASWADFFSKEADEWRESAWEIIKRCPNLIFQVLTKRHGRIAANLPEDWGDGYPNVWLGVSGEDQEWSDRRWESLSKISAAVRFISYEPALGPLSIAHWNTFPDWIIIGGESGRDSRQFDVEWAVSLIDECRVHGVSPFLKQLGYRPVDGGPQGTDDMLRIKDAHGGEESEWPSRLRGHRHFPVHE